MPREDALVIDDLIRGRVEFEWAGEQDHVVQRADGSCLYHLATVVDDHDFDISHVIRAEEHLSNTPRQVFIARQLDYHVPAFAHLPLVAEPGSRNKLSKRKLEKYLKNADFAEICSHGQSIARKLGRPADSATFNPVIVDFYEAVGYLPDAIVNYLVRLGWSLDDRTEILSREQMIRLFSLERVGRGPASFDPAKLMAIQQHYMQKLSVEQKVALSIPFLIQAGLAESPAGPQVEERLRSVLNAAGPRIRVAGDILEYAEFFLPDEQFPCDEAAFEKRVRKPPEAAGLLGELRSRLAAIESFEAAGLEEAVEQFAESHGVGMGQIVHALRVALTGKSIGFGLYDCLAILGKDSSLARIDRALARIDRPLT
jgi:glutamyl-tRNA synthetase